MRKSFVFVLFLFFSSVHYSASALWYTRLSDSTVKVVYNTSYDTTSNWHVTIPNTVYMKFSTDNVYRNYKVISIADNAFKNCTNIHSVSIGKNVSTIGSQAFYGCSGLELLVIGENVSTIGNSAFYGCNNIKRLYYNARNCASASGYDATYSQYYYFSHFHGQMDHLIIGDSVQVIPQKAFYGCSADTLTIGTNVTSIGTQAFLGWYDTQVLYYNAKNCANAIGNNNFQSSLNRLIIGESVVSIPHSAFSGFSSLDGKLVIPNNVTTIGNSAFQGCSNIDSLEFGENLCTIGNNAFYGCSSVDGFLTIPNSVTTIGSSAFQNCSSIKSLELGYNLCTIGDNAFNGCADLDGMLIIPNSVEAIGQYAFNNCDEIDSVKIGPKVSSIGDAAFQGCTSLEYLYYNIKNFSSHPFYGLSQLHSLVIGDSTQSIPEYAFKNCSGIASVTIGANVTTIGYGAFDGCTSLDGKLVIPNNVISIGNNAFCNCSGIDSLVIGVNVSSIGNYAFFGNVQLSTIYWDAINIVSYPVPPNSGYSNLLSVLPYYGCSSLKKVVFGEYVKSIPQYAFSGITSIQSITIGDSVINLQNHAFEGCTGLDGKLIIPNSVASIGSYAFSNCYGIDSLIIGDGVSTIGDYAFHNCSGLDGKLSVPNGVAAIGTYAFFNCSGIDSLVIGENVSSIGDYAFQGCSGIRKLYFNAQNCTTALSQSTFSPFYGAVQNYLQNLIIGENVISVGSYAFQGCTSLNGELIIPNSVTSIGQYAFNNCSGIDTLVIGENVSSVGNYAFQGCAGIRKLCYNAKNCTTQLCGNANAPFYGAMQSNLQTLVIGNNVVSIPSSAFHNCTGLSGRLIIPSGVKAIGSYAFYNCSGLDGKLVFTDSITTVSPYVLYGCSGIDSLILGNNIFTVGQCSFSNCTELSNIQFSPSLQFIGKKAFYNCDNLLSVDIDSAQVTFGDSAFADCDRLVTANLGINADTIGVGTFAGCFRLTTVNMGNLVTSIGNDAFRDCIRLVSPKLSNALTTIGSDAFRGCSLIAGQLTIPETVTSIGAGAYSGCSGITSIFSKPQDPPTIFATTFDSVNTSIPVYVPCGRVVNYYVTDYWENFPNILEMEPYLVELSVNNEAMGSVAITSPPTCGNPQAIIAATSNEGFHFIHWSDGNTNNPRVVSLNQDTSLVAYFTINQAYISVHSNDTVKGHVSGSGLYVYNAPVVLMATANEGYHFIHWNDGNTQNPRYITATTDSVFTAIFVSNLSNINVLNNNPEMGTVSGSGVYYYQNYATLSATPNYGYHFTHWNDGNTDNPRMLFVDRDTTFIASFALNVYAINASSENTTMGSVTGGGNYTYNMQISLTANANFGYHFSQWSDGNTQNPRNVVVTADSIFTAQFAANIYTLSVSSNDPDMGSAYGAGTFTYNTQTTISAAANYGYHFTQWSDGNTENPRIVTINGNREYIAMFAINFYTITVNSSNPALGNASGGGTYNYNSNISITATPNYGYHFTQWSDGNTQNPRNITVVQNATYTAQFAVNTYSVTVNSNNANMGMVLGGGNYIYQTPATISAIPNYGYHFVQWNDGNTENPRTIIITQNEVFSAQFDYNTYTLTALSNNYLAGTVTGGGTYNYSSVVSVLAVPNEHYHFVQWSDLLTDNPRNITMTQDTMITAQFEIDQHTVTVQSANATMGSVSGGGTFSYGTAIPISATANYGYHFVTWSDGSTQNPRTIMVDGDATFTAVFEANQYVVSCQSSDPTMGTVSGAGTYPYLTSVTLQAIPQTGYHFTQWSDGNTDNPRIITLTKDTVLNAQFAINMYMVNITINDSTMGSVSGSGIYPYLSQVTVSATAAEHHHFVQWGDGSTSNPRQFTVSSDLLLEAIFAEDARFVISAFTSDTLMGQVYGAGEYYAGTQISLTAVPNAHYQFMQWTDGVTDNPRSIVVLENATFVAVFSPLSYDILAYSANEMMGTVTGSGTYAYHTEVTLEAIAHNGYHFVSWSDGETSAVRTIVVEGNATFIANFAEGIGIEEYQEEASLKIYPNPAYESVTIEGVEAKQVDVIDMMGRVVLSESSSNMIFVNSLPTGVYLLRITTENGIVEKKLMKK